MKLARFEPWPSIDMLRSDFASAPSRRATSSWVPAVDIVEYADRFILRADVPGVSPEDIDVSMDAGVLTVTGVRHAEERDEGVSFQRTERSSGKFIRRFNLPDTADAENIRARSSNGILDIEIPKAPEIQARRITVEAA